MRIRWSEDPDMYQNVTDPQQCYHLACLFSHVIDQHCRSLLTYNSRGHSLSSAARSPVRSQSGSAYIEEGLT
jgi:hypothetical protein